MSLGARDLTPELVDETLGVILKYEEDIRQLRGEQTKRMVSGGRRARLTSDGTRPAAYAGLAAVFLGARFVVFALVGVLAEAVAVGAAPEAAGLAADALVDAVPAARRVVVRARVAEVRTSGRLPAGRRVRLSSPWK